MLSALGVILIFLAKAFIIVASIIVVALFFTSLALKQTLGDEKFKLTNLSEEIEDTYRRLFKKTLGAKELKALKKRQKKGKKKRKEEKHKDHKLFVLDFSGDIKASEAENFKKCITQTLKLANPKKDEVLVRLESPGGIVSGYGLAASELSRLRTANIPLTISVDKVAASGGYLMSCVANKIIAAPFAVVGSIGVVAGMPNFNKLLKKNNIDYELLTAGKYKRTLTLFGENTEEGRKKFLEQLEQIHMLFKNFVKKYRPQLDIESVATGDYWFGEDALKLNLVDEIKTSEDYILESASSKEVYHLEYKEKKKLADKLMQAASAYLTRSPTDLI